jgi:hypothetical protein
MRTGTLQQDMAFDQPTAALFFNHSPGKLIVACCEGIFIVDVSTQSVQPLKRVPTVEYNHPENLVLSDDDAVLVVVGEFTVASSKLCGYDTASRRRLWMNDIAGEVLAVCMLGQHVLANIWKSNLTLVLDSFTGDQIAVLQTTERNILGLGVIEGLCFILFLNPQISSDLHTSVYLAMLQHLLYKQSKSLHLPLEMWDWIAKYRV